MIKIIHAADLHLDSAFSGRTEAAAARLRQELCAVPEKIAALCRREHGDILLLAGDIFDGAHTKKSAQALKIALEELNIPVFIAPGNHDFCAPGSAWLTESWPTNVHIFREPTVCSVALPQLDCRVYGAGFACMDSDALLPLLHTQGSERYHIGVFHGDPLQSDSPYNPISQAQVENTGLDYLALGHIHKNGAFRVGKTLCAWPGCPMGRGYDETEEKGVLVVELAQRAEARFVALDTPRFYDWVVPVRTTAHAAIAERLPAVGNENHYRITLTGETEKPDTDALHTAFAAFANLELRDRTQPPVDIWARAEGDTLEGAYFRLLRRDYTQGDDDARQSALLAAQISAKILDGNEVELP